MNEFYFNVSQKGHHVFRTDWQDNLAAVAVTQLALTTRFPKSEGFEVSKHGRSKLQTMEVVS